MGRAWASPRTRSPLSLLLWLQKTQVQVPMRGSSCMAAPGAVSAFEWQVSSAFCVRSLVRMRGRCWPPNIRAAHMQS